MKTIEHYFANKEIRAFHFCENLKGFLCKSKREKHYIQQTFMENRQTLLVEKIHLPERINLTEEENNFLLTNYEEVAKELNNCLANAVKNPNIPYYENCDSLGQNIEDPILQGYC